MRLKSHMCRLAWVDRLLGNPWEMQMMRIPEHSNPLYPIFRMLNPCCCISPRIGTFIFAVFDLVVGLSTVFWAVKVVLDAGERIETWIEFGFAILLLFLAILLLYGTLKNSYENIRLWLILWIILILLFIVFQIFNVTTAPTGGDKIWRFSSMGGTLLLIYQIWVVWAFATELRYGPAALTYCPAQIV